MMSKGMKVCKKCGFEGDSSQFSSSMICRNCYNAERRAWRRRPPKVIDTHRTCTKCGLEKEISCFEKHRRQCMDCRAEYKKEQRIGYYESNRSEIISKVSKYCEENKDSVAEYQKIYHQAHKKERNQRQRNAKKNNPHIKLHHSVSNSIRVALKRVGSPKKGKSILDFLPYTIQELKEYIESKFEDWMSWENWGKYNVETWDDDNPTTWTWQLDHIIAQINFPYYSMEDENFKKCWALSNLRPYSAKQNVIEKDRRNA